MAHDSQAEYFSLVREHFPSHFEQARVLEVGSLNINGSVRDLFTRCDYTGADLKLGPGVDVAKPGQMLDFPSGTFDTVVSAECLEHNPFWVETVANMLRMLRPGGLIMISCATTGRKEHGTTRSSPEASPFTVAERWDYYKNLSARDVERAVNLSGWCSDHRFATNMQSYDLYFVGLRRGQGEGADAAATLPPALLQQMKQRYRPGASWRTAKRTAKVLVFGDKLSR
jgi:SAM-dependent methyltransferase